MNSGAAPNPRLFAAVLTVLRPGGWFHLESGDAGNVARLTRLLDDIAARHGLPPAPPFPDTGLVFEQVEAAGFEIPAEGVRTVAQRRPFSSEQVTDFLRTQGTLVLTRHAGLPERRAQLGGRLVPGTDAAGDGSQAMPPAMIAANSGTCGKAGWAVSGCPVWTAHSS